MCSRCGCPTFQFVSGPRPDRELEALLAEEAEIERRAAAAAPPGEETPTALPPEIRIGGDAFDALNIVAQKCWDISDDKGWHEPELREDGTVRDASAVERIMLIVSEASEMMEAYREVGTDDCPVKDKPSSSYYAVRDKRGWWKPEGVAAELADVIIRCGDYAIHYGIDLGMVVKEKLEYNQTRTRKHGGKTI